MVGTRHSLPNVDSVNPSDNDPNVPKELRRLHINGKDTMRGTKVEKPKKKLEQVYHWRGAAYAVTPDTPQEWLDQEPDRFKRKRSQEEERAEVSTSSGKNTLKRKTTSYLEGTTLTDTTTNNTPDGDDDDDMADTRRASKRPRRNTINHVPTTATRLRKSTTNASMKKKREFIVADESTLKFDFTLANHQRILSKIETEKEAARDKGYSVDMYTDREVKQAKQERARQPQRPSSLGAILGRDIARIAKLNDAISVLSRNYEDAKAAGVYEAILDMKAARMGGRKSKRVAAEDYDDDSEAEVVSLMNDGATPGAEIPTIEVQPSSDDLAGEDLRLATVVDEVFDDRDTQSQLESQLNDDFNDDDDDDDTLDPISLPGTSMRDSHSESEVSEDHSSLRHDSATSATSPDLAPSSHATSIEKGDAMPGANKMSPASRLRSLPSKNRNGDTLRWSLGSESLGGISKEKRCGSGTDRAEGLIHRGRMNGESKSARRRRVAREMKFLQSWPVDGEESANA